ncbi:hypothetical protein K2P97_06770 [bacterium]|nr:hypothetical protein [bacterium]
MRYKAPSLTLSIGFCIAFLGLLAHAQTTSTTVSAPQGTTTYKAPKAKKSSDELTTGFGVALKAISYTESSAVDSNSQQQVQAEFNMKKTGSFFTETNIMVGTFSHPNSFHYAFPQAFVGFGSSNSNVTIGRKLENLSFADTFFHFGLLQSHFTSDNIEFIQGGLTGVAGHLSSGSMGIMGSFNPIFIPNQGPETTAESGKIVSSNRWAPQPPSKFKFGDQHRDINYAINDYKITDIISHGGYMVNAYAGAGANPKRPLLVASYSKKPINEVALSRDTFSNIANFEGYVYLTPVVVRHEVQAYDLNMDYRNFKSTLSYIADQPDNVQAKNLEFMQQLNPLSIVTLYAAIDLSSQFGKKFEAYAAAASITGGEIKDVDANGNESIFTVATSRTQFKKPIKFGVISEMFFIYNRALEADLNMTYDSELKGSLLSAKFKYEAMKNLNLTVGADVIGVEKELPDGEQGNFLDQNKANDRFFGGVKYVF